MKANAHFQGTFLTKEYFITLKEIDSEILILGSVEYPFIIIILKSTRSGS